MAELFSDAWARAWGEELARSESYRQAAAGWEGPVVFRLKGAEDRAIFLDLHDGKCNAARTATADDYEKARYVLSADLPTWLSVLDGTISVLPAVLRGRLRLEKGRLSSLLPYTAAAKELVHAATSVEAQLPGGDSLA